ncbi:isatin hydrolase-like [Haliotis rubra]|uniref:isatin hydrolase-like n=1 Tax=Haliotis rubra TaxID=36100 RepID=UPI001EE53810|nr:isatin hydrolase-like [Haliotis rubra]XP_046576666.1 isatin hydrolase-like [Haliotis rubra]
MAGSHLVLVSVLLSSVSGHMQVVDLTWTVGPSTVYWPGSLPFNFTSVSDYSSGYQSNWFSTPEHGGTHLDAPSHFFEGGWRADEIPADRLIGPTVILDVTSQAEADPDYRVTQSDFEAYERKHGRIPLGAIVIMNSGWESRFPNRSRVFNTDTPNNISTFHFPGYHEDAIAWMVANRNVSMVGVDTPSLDYGQSTDFKVHKILGRNNIPGLENVARISQIPEKGASITVGIIKLFGGSGGPARILATYDTHAEPNDCTSGSMNILTTVSTKLLFVLLTVSVI